ncbi:MAG: SDR family NAD(P)-dependent oxidoreductase [Clostridiales bacterium]|nr:SDR family NAD(P)-dependent oxidoreductase [Clostridiales bacterium]
MKKIAIITGAGSGIGKEFVKQIVSPDIDEIWAVGRNINKLNGLKEEYGDKIVPLQADISTEEGLDIIKGSLDGQKPDVVMLINNAGTAYFGKFEDMEADPVRSLVDINCKAPSVLCHMVLPYMREGGRILNISSASSFQPNPYLTMYAASKVYLKNFSRALNQELKLRKITVTAVCPGWVDTDMLRNENGERTAEFPGMVTAEKVVAKALKDSSKGKDISMSSLYNSYLRFYSKVTPHKIVMKQWIYAIRKYIDVSDKK